MDLDEVIEQYHEALKKFSRGDPERLKRLYSHRGDVVLANPFGPAVRGWDQASQALEYASSRFRDGEVTAFEEVARYASADLVVIHEKEQWQAKVSGGEELSRFGLRVTRAALVNPLQKRDPSGTHLAIYVEPTGEYTPQDYIDGTVDVTKVFLPYVFTRWKDLKSFDVCQEPRPVVDDRASPAPETQVYATRAGNKLVDWKTVDVATMIRTSQEEAAATPTNGDPQFSVFVAKHLQITPQYQQLAGTAATTTPTSPTVRDYG